MLDSQGRAGDLSPTGFYFRETRCLRTLRLRIGDPVSGSSAEVGHNALEFSGATSRWNHGAEFVLAWELAADLTALSEATADERELRVAIAAENPVPAGVDLRPCTSGYMAVE